MSHKPKKRKTWTDTLIQAAKILAIAGAVGAGTGIYAGSQANTRDRLIKENNERAMKRMLAESLIPKKHIKTENRIITYNPYKPEIYNPVQGYPGFAYVSKTDLSKKR